MADDHMIVLWAAYKCPELCKVKNVNGDLPLHLFRKLIVDGEDVATVAAAYEAVVSTNPAALETTNSSGQLPIHKFATCEKKPFLQRMIDGYPQGLTMFGKDGLLPVHYACIAGQNMNRVRVLLGKSRSFQPVSLLPATKDRTTLLFLSCGFHKNWTSLTEHDSKSLLTDIFHMTMNSLDLFSAANKVTTTPTRGLKRTLDDSKSVQ